MGAGVSMAAAGRAELAGQVVGVIAEGPCRRLSEGAAGILRGLRFPRFPFAWLGPILAQPWARGIATLDRTQDARRLTCPLLVLHGSEDPVCPAAAAAAIAGAAPTGWLVSFPGGGHLGLALSDEPRYREALDRLWAAVEPGPSPTAGEPIAIRNRA